MFRQWKAVTRLAFMGCLLLGLALSQGWAQGTVTVADHETHGSYLADGEGRSLYLFTQDEEGSSACTGDCAEAWPPFTVADGATAGDGVAQSLLGAIERQDGSRQVTYNGHPLYYFAQDTEDVPVAGHGVGGVWFLVSPYGEAVAVPEEETEDAAAEDEAASEPVPEDVRATGDEVYSQHCAACHAADGSGGAGPALSNANLVEDEGDVVNQILFGGNRMPAFGDTLSDAEVAAVATHVRNSFGNEFGLTTEEEVAEER